MSGWEQQSDRDTSREPCPHRMVEDIGGAYSMGLLGGSLWHFAKGSYNSPAGERMAGAMFSMRARAPLLGAAFASWGGTFSFFDCSLIYIRQRDDHFNAIASGFLTGGVLAARSGWKSASRNALVGGVLLAVIEGVSAVMQRKFGQTPKEQTIQAMEQQRQMEEMKAQGVDPNTAASWGGYAASFAPSLPSWLRGAVTVDAAAAATGAAGGRNEEVLT